MKILIISLKHLGDIITTTTVLPMLKKIYPESTINYMVNPEGLQLIKNHPLVNKVYLATRKNSFKENLAFLSELRKEKYDIVIDYSEGDRSAFWAKLTGAKIRIGYNTNKKYLSRNILYTHLLPNRSKEFNRPVTHCHADAIKLLGHSIENIPNPSIFFSPTAKEKTLPILEKYSIDINKPYAVAHFTARDEIRLLPVKHCVDTIDYLFEKTGQVVLVSWNDPKERAFIEKIKAATKIPIIDLCGELDLDSLMYLIKKSNIFIGLDSLVGHLSAALNTPTIGIFGPSSEVHWAPKGAKVKIAHRNKPCRPCVVGGCLGNQISACLKELEFETYIKPLIDEFLSTPCTPKVPV